MSVNKEPSGRRSVEMRVEVPGTPEEVWRAIATGPGITAWFVAAEVEERVGGKIHFDFGDDMKSVGEVTAWEPPYRMEYVEREWNGKAPPIATECHVEAQAGGTCIFRMVHSLFATSDEWDDQLEGFESGWPGFFRILRIYMTHFRNQSSTHLRLNASEKGSEAEAWDRLANPLGLENVKADDQFSSPSGAPPLRGLVERVADESRFHEVLLRMQEPGPGVASIGAFTWEGTVRLTISLYLYGENAAAVAQRAEPQWKEWLGRHFPPAGDSGNE